MLAYCIQLTQHSNEISADDVNNNNNNKQQYLSEMSDALIEPAHIVSCLISHVMLTAYKWASLTLWSVMPNSQDYN